MGENRNVSVQKPGTCTVNVESIPIYGSIGLCLLKALLSCD